jgi:hypothetical protein
MKLRDRVRTFLWSLFDWVASKEMLNASEQRQIQRHQDMMGMLNRIEQRMINTHVGQPRELSIPVLDWDTVQAIALHEMEKNPPKEN